MDAPSSPAAVRVAVRSSLSVRRGSSDIIVSSTPSFPATAFPKSARILRSKDFRRVYDNGIRFSSSLFTAFCLREAPPFTGPHIGFTTPRALGVAVVRNRIRRRVREALRVRLQQLSPQWSIVINPRRKALDCPFPDIEREIDRLLGRCNEL